LWQVAQTKPAAKRSTPFGATFPTIVLPRLASCPIWNGFENHQHQLGDAMPLTSFVTAYDETR
jgi:hypothetical protein